MSDTSCRAEPLGKTPTARLDDRSPVRDVLRSYARDSYVLKRSTGSSAPPEAFASHIDCAPGIFESAPSPRLARALREFDVSRLDRYTPFPVEAHFKRAILDRM